MSDEALLWFALGLMSGIVVVGVAVLVNERMKTNEAPRRQSTFNPG